MPCATQLQELKTSSWTNAPAHERTYYVMNERLVPRAAERPSERAAQCHRGGAVLGGLRLRLLDDATNSHRYVRGPSACRVLPPSELTRDSGRRSLVRPVSVEQHGSAAKRTLMKPEACGASSKPRFVCCIRLFDIICDHAIPWGGASREGSRQRRSRPSRSDRTSHMGTASGEVAACPCGPPVQPAGERQSSQDQPGPLRGTPPQDQHADPRTTDRPLRHRLLLPVEG